MSTGVNFTSMAPALNYGAASLSHPHECCWPINQFTPLSNQVVTSDQFLPVAASQLELQAGLTPNPIPDSPFSWAPLRSTDGPSESVASRNPHLMWESPCIMQPQIPAHQCCPRLRFPCSLETIHSSWGADLPPWTSLFKKLYPKSLISSPFPQGNTHYVMGTQPKYHLQCSL